MSDFISPPAKWSITRRFRFDAGHRLMKATGPCADLHGHTYTVEVTLFASRLNGFDMILDFDFMKKKIGSWIKENWDHVVLLNWDDSAARVLSQTTKVFTFNEDPTAEILAMYLCNQLSTQFEPIVKAIRVTIYETPDCWATYTKNLMGEGNEGS
jgi:6-pyruvoyltetrahydropterin/6-carboxytetrahydropterin synthase